MKINWFILLSITLMQSFMLHGADNVSASITATIAKVPLTQDQIIILAEQAVDHGITSQTCIYKATLQKKVIRLLTFRSKMQSANLRRQSARHIINQQCLYRGHIQANHYDATTAPSDSSKQSWGTIFEKKMLTESADEQAEISWAHETASLLIQYWPTYTAYQSRKKREEIKNLMNSAVNDATIDAQASTIAKMPLTQDQITTIAQQAIASYMIPQTRKYEATLQKKLASFLVFRSKAQHANLMSQNAGLIIQQQSLNFGYIQADQYAGTTASSSAINKQSWSDLFKNKLLTESASKQAEIAWTYEAASLLIQYWPIYNTYMAQKQRERTARKREQAYDSVEEIDELLHKNRRHNDSPAPFVPIADEQTPASSDSCVYSNNDTLTDTYFRMSNEQLLCFDIPTPTIEDYDYYRTKKHDEN